LFGFQPIRLETKPTKLLGICHSAHAGCSFLWLQELERRANQTASVFLQDIPECLRFWTSALQRSRKPSATQPTSNDMVSFSGAPVDFCWLWGFDVRAEPLPFLADNPLELRF
jgi:hypothetical protein